MATKKPINAALMCSYTAKPRFKIWYLDVNIRKKPVGTFYAAPERQRPPASSVWKKQLCHRELHPAVTLHQISREGAGAVEGCDMCVMNFLCIQSWFVLFCTSAPVSICFIGFYF